MDRAYVIRELKENINAVYHLSKAMRADKEIAMVALTHYYPYNDQHYVVGEIYSVFSEEVRNDREVIGMGWEAEGISILPFITDKSVFKDKEFWLKTLKRNYRNRTDESILLKYIDPQLRTDEDILKGIERCKS